MVFFAEIACFLVSLVLAVAWVAHPEAPLEPWIVLGVGLDTGGRPAFTLHARLSRSQSRAPAIIAGGSAGPVGEDEEPPYGSGASTPQMVEPGVTSPVSLDEYLEIKRSMGLTELQKQEYEAQLLGKLVTWEGRVGAIQAPTREEPIYMGLVADTDSL